MTTKTPKRFRIAFSFAGEKRAYVAQVALLLAEKFGEDKILYDKYHEAEFARYDLGIYLPKLYREEAELVVAVICPNYDQKQWTGWEWMAIYSQLSKREGQNIMLTRFEYAEVDGLFDPAAFVELDHKTPEQASTLILERLALNEGWPKDHYTKPTMPQNTSTPNNLPRLQYFFGREADLKKIADALTPDARGWGALIDGPGGIGKTTLAIRAAELVPPGRFRRIIYLSAKKRALFADGQRALGNFVVPGYLEILNAITRELGKPELSKSPETERAEVVLRALRETAVLLVLDNLETLPESDRDQLFAFLNHLPRGCSALATSRRRADASAVSIRLDKLDWLAANELISEIAKQNERLQQADESERRELYDETGGNPLLIRWVTGQLGLGRCQTIETALDFLRMAPANNNPLAYIFSDLLENFTANETKVLAALAHFTTPVESTFIAEIAGLNEAAAQGALSDLASRALVLSDLEDHCFVLVPMVADFLRRERSEVVSETGKRLEHYAYEMIMGNGGQRHDRFPLLDAAWPTVGPALPLYVAGPNQRLQSVCETLDNFFRFTGRWDEWLSLNKQAEAKAVAAGDYKSAGWRVCQMGWVYIVRKQAGHVLDSANHAVAHWQRITPSASERASSIRLRGIGQALKKEYKLAIEDLNEALDLWQSVSSESIDIAITLNAIANVRADSGDFKAAEQDYRKALQVARAIGYSEGVALYMGNLVELVLDQDNWIEAEVLAREAISLSEKLGRLELTAANDYRLAKALVRQGKSTEAFPYAQQAVEVFTWLGSPDLGDAQAILRECEAVVSSS